MITDKETIDELGARNQIKKMTPSNEKEICEKKRINEIGFKGQLRKCDFCKDVKIWDYPNIRKCPSGKNHKWRGISQEEMTEKDKISLNRCIELDKKIKHKPQIIINSEEDIKKFIPKENNSQQTKQTEDLTDKEQIRSISTLTDKTADRKTELSESGSRIEDGSVPNQELNKIAHFISNFEYYEIEKSGNKNYTIRDLNKKVESKLKDATHILIRKGYTSESFVRKISYILKWKDNIIISWREE